MDRITLPIRRAYYRRKFGKDEGERRLQEDLEVEQEGQAIRDAQAMLIKSRQPAIQAITQKNRLIYCEKELLEKLQKLQTEGQSESQIAEVEKHLAEVSLEKEAACQRVEVIKEEIYIEEAALRKRMDAFKKRKEAIQDSESP